MLKLNQVHHYAVLHKPENVSDLLTLTTEDFQRPKLIRMSGTVGNSLTSALSLQIQLVVVSSSISRIEHNQFIRFITLQVSHKL